MRVKAFRVIWILLLAGVGLSCASTEETGRASADDDDGHRPRDERGIMAQDAQSVATVQLFRTGDEAAIPLLAMDGTQTLTLAFDVMGSRTKPLSVYFYHADREWRRDLVPAEYLTSFHRDNLVDYQLSRATHVPYVHYAYEFPNASIGFRLSGNYVIRITEQGMEEDILFERPFFVSEQATPLDFNLGQVRVTGDPFPAVQPSVRFTPPQGSTGTAFDYTVCFLRNGQRPSERCTDRPGLDYQPSLRYYLEPEESFVSGASDYFVDISTLRAGGRIERADLLERPYQLLLEPDYFRFPGTATAPLQNGQILVQEAVRNVGDPGTAAEYADVRFALVPEDEISVPGRVYLIGPFNNWTPSAGTEMQWVASSGRYEGSVLLKQGRYEYRYAFTNQSVAREARGVSARFDNMITAFVYFDDLRLSTDRLISAESVVTR
ncbi:MAG: hypothetical protein ACI9W4_002811 [Rhodothermales bacterium]|jgi:hypothetical protein